MSRRDLGPRSYNVPFFDEVYNATGYPGLIAEMEAEDPVKYAGAIRWLKYQICPRAEIFRRDQAAVKDLHGMQALMRYNSWRHDPYADSNPTFAVCGRGDLLQSEPLPKGCFDSKVTSYQLSRDMEAEVVNGPAVTADQTPFSWAAFPNASDFAHRGHPDVFDFEFERMSCRDLPVPGARC